MCAVSHTSSQTFCYITGIKKCFLFNSLISSFRHSFSRLLSVCQHSGQKIIVPPSSLFRKNRTFTFTSVIIRLATLRHLDESSFLKSKTFVFVSIGFSRFVYCIWSDDLNSQGTPSTGGFPQCWGIGKFSSWGNPPALGKWNFFNRDFSRFGVFQ